MDKTKNREWHFTVRKNLIILAAVLVVYGAISVAPYLISGSRTARLGGESYDIYTTLRLLLSGKSYTIGDEELQEICRMKNLTQIDLSGSSFTIRDKSLWNELPTSITMLALNDCDLTDADLAEIPWGRMQGLRDIRLSDNPEVTDLSVLKDVLPQVGLLDIDRTGISDLDALEQAERLGNLYAAGLGLENADIEVLSNCSNISHLDLSDNSLTSLDGIGDPKKIWMLWVDHNHLADLDVLEDAFDLITLSAAGNELRSVDALASCRKLTQVDLSDNDLEDISGLYSCSEVLTDLYLEGNRLNSLDALQAMPALRSLVIDDNTVADLAILEGSPELRLLSAARNHLTTMPQITDLAKLQEVYLQGNEITGEVVLENPSLLRICLQHNKVTTLKLETSLKMLVLYDNPLTDFTRGSENGVTHLYLSYRPELDTVLAEDFGDELLLLDCPKPAQAVIAETWKGKNPVVITMEEAMEMTDGMGVTKALMRF